MSKIEDIQNCAKIIFEEIKGFDYVEIAHFDDGGAHIEIDGVEVFIKANGEIERVDIGM